MYSMKYFKIFSCNSKNQKTEKNVMIYKSIAKYLSLNQKKIITIKSDGQIEPHVNG